MTMTENALLANELGIDGVLTEHKILLPTVYFDITDAILFLRDNVNVSGIQRVITCLFTTIKNNIETFSNNVKFCYFDGDTKTVFEVSDTNFSNFLKLIKNPNIKRDILNKQLSQSINKNAIIPIAGDVYVILGAFWVSPNYSQIFQLYNSLGIKIGVYIYDLIPITSHEFVARITARGFAEQLLKIISHSDFVMTISKYVGQEVSALVSRTLHNNIPVFPIPLAQDIDIIPASGAMSRKILAATSKPFILCVGTIEIRKNHAFLIKVWERLIKSQPDQVPRLVIVGRWGWHVDDLKAMLEGTNYLDDAIVVMSDVADSELSYLYEKCLFTVFPSFVEGWGLPIGESLVHGKLCVASNTSSMPEVGGDFVQYIDPYNLTGGIEVISRLINNPSEVRAAEKRIREEFKPRTWADVAADMAKAISAVPGQAVGRNDPRCTLPQGEIIAFSHNQVFGTSPQELKKFTYQIACDEGWDVPEDWGRWALSRSPRLRFKLQGIVDSRQLRLALRLQLPAPDCRVEVTALSGGEATTFIMPNGLPHWYFVSGRAQDDGTVDIKLTIKGTIPKVDPVRSLFIGMSRLAIVEQDNFENRMQMMEMIRSIR